MTDQTDETLSTHPKLINKENSRSEIWHYFGYKTDDKGERTGQLLHLYASVAIGLKSCCHMDTSNIFKHLSLAHPDLFQRIKRSTGECIIHKF